jgi:hypothetical protein
VVLSEGGGGVVMRSLAGSSVLSRTVGSFQPELTITCHCGGIIVNPRLDGGAFFCPGCAKGFRMCARDTAEGRRLVVEGLKDCETPDDPITRTGKGLK